MTDKRLARLLGAEPLTDPREEDVRRAIFQVSRHIYTAGRRDVLEALSELVTR